VAALTALFSFAEAVDCVRRGAFDYLEKPLTADTLAITVATAARYPPVCGNFRHRENRGNSHEMTEYNNYEREPKPDVRHSVTEPQKENRPKYGAY